jgi:hypothetical protein
MPKISNPLAGTAPSMAAPKASAIGIPPRGVLAMLPFLPLVIVS